MSSILAAGLCSIPPCASAQGIGSPVADDASRSGSASVDPSSLLPSPLETRGLSFDLLYIGEAFRGVHLLPPDTVGYRGNVNLHLTLNSAQAGWWEGGTLFLDLQHGHGRNFQLVLDGVSQFLSAIDSPGFTQVYQWGLEQSLVGGRLRLRVGKQDSNDIFAVNSLGQEFISPPFTLIPTVPLPTFPAPAMGAVLLVAPDRPLSVRAGFFDGGSSIGGLGLDSFLDGDGGYFTVLEPVLSTHLGPADALPGTWRLGLWHHSGLFPATGQQGLQLRGNHGAYLVVDQMLSVQPEDGSGRGAGVFLQLGWSPADRNTVSRYLGVGLKYVGILPGRDADVLAVGLGVSRWNPLHHPGEHREVRNLELFYVVRLSSWASLQPDLQVFDPGSDTAAHAWAFGLRWIVRLR